MSSPSHITSPGTVCIHIPLLQYAVPHLANETTEPEETRNAKNGDHIGYIPYAGKANKYKKRIE